MAETKTMDEKLEEKLDGLGRQLISRLKSEDVRSDSRGEYFSNKQLSDLRMVLEKRGFAVAKQFQRARVRLKDDRWERVKNETVLDFLEGLEKLKLDLVTSAFIIGRLNPILSQIKTKDTHRNKEESQK